MAQVLPKAGRAITKAIIEIRPGLMRETARVKRRLVVIDNLKTRG